MKNSYSKQPLNLRLLPQVTQRLYEGLIVLTLALSLYLLISLWTFSANDAGWSHTGGVVIHNAGGEIGAWIADFLFYWIGLSAYVFPGLCFLGAMALFQNRSIQLNYSTHLVFSRFIGAIIAIFSLGAFLSLHFAEMYSNLPMQIGGVLGQVLAEFAKKHFNLMGGTLVLISCLLFGITLLTGFSWANLSHSLFLKLIKVLQGWVHWLKKIFHKLFLSIYKLIKNKLDKLKIRPKAELMANKEGVAVLTANKQSLFPANSTNVISLESGLENNLFKEDVKKPSIRQQILKNTKKMKVKLPTHQSTAEDLPSFSLLEAPAPLARDLQQMSDSALQSLSKVVEEKLADFGIIVKVVAIHPGPVITRFELQLAPGIKVSKISTLAKDLARSLSVMSVRVVEIIPGKPVIGLELPNTHRQIVRLKDILNTEVYQQMLSPLTLALGKDIAGMSVAVDLAKMPHLLVAGTTGSGKSVGLNGMILSMLYKSSPEQVRFIMIDPKMLELSIYEGIPHLLAPVVTDMKEASNALRWAVAEMERRYQLMAAMGVRNLSSYNKKVIEAEQKGSPLIDPSSADKPDDERELLRSMPNIVIVVDELADLMMVVGKKVEELIARIAQKARAAGIHLILATQRPSVDVITGLIKANIPTRIAYQVASRIDSRTILDQQGAEQLLGQGDMLYLPIGAGIPVRVHGAFVADQEVHRVVKHWREIAEPDYQEEIVAGLHQNTQNINPGLLMQAAEDELDPLYDEAVKIITETRRASISLVQRKLKIGYNRSARLLEEMENQGVVSAMQQNGTREVLAPPPVVVGN